MLAQIDTARFQIAAQATGAVADAAQTPGRSASSIKDTAKAFEAVFLNTMLQSMFTGLGDGGSWGAGLGSDAWQGMLIEEFSKNIAAAGGIGIAATVERELLAFQEFQP